MNYFNLFSNILITKGIKRVLVIDLQRNTSELFPLELEEIIQELGEKSVEDLIHSYHPDSRGFIEEYINLLLDRELGFMTKDDWDKNFPPFSYDFRSPNQISNAYLEIDDLEILPGIEKSFTNLGVEHLVLFFHRSLKITEFKSIEDIFHKATISSIEIFSVFESYIDEAFLSEINKSARRIYNLVFYSCNENELKMKPGFRFNVSFAREKIALNSCGKVGIKYFAVNLPKVLEAINHNSCLHKKIAIDINGDIKNCPSMKQSFGNIREVSLEEALGHNAFKKYWNLTKDHIAVCRDCEFRYVCTDCRAYTEQTDESNGLDTSKPLKCGYDPYTASWQEWSTHPMKQQAIQHYGITLI